MQKIYLVDGMSIVFRAYHAMLKSGLTAPNGEPSGAVYGFINILTSLLEKENPEKIIVAFDRKEPTFRHEKYNLYKANRLAFPEDLVPQLKRIKEFLDIAKIPQVELPRYEADDIIGTLSKRASEKGYEVICITSDKDFYQLVNERVKLYKPSRTKKNEFDIVSFPEVFNKFGVEPDKVIDVLAILGDTSDNIPGVKGVGEKTAIPLIQKYQTLENLYEHLDEIDKKAVKSKLETNKENAFLSKDLVTIDTDAPIEIDFETTKIEKPDYTELNDFFNTMGFRKIKQKWLAKASPDDAAKIDDDENIVTDKLEDIEKSYHLIDDIEKLDKLIVDLKNAKLLSVDLETSSLDRQNCEIVGISLSFKEGTAYYIAVFEESKSKENKFEFEPDGQGNLFGANPETKPPKVKEEPQFKSIPLDIALDKLRPYFESNNIDKCGQNIKFDAFILRRHNINLSPIKFDSMIASYILNPDNRHNLDALSQKWLNYTPIPISSLIGEKKSKQISMKEIDPKLISDYACEDADYALKLRNRLYEELKKENLLKLAEEVDFPLIEVLLKMEHNGVSIDKDFLKDLSIQIRGQAQKLTKKIYAEAGTEFNIDSPKQLGHILFEKLMIPPVKKTKTGYSTDVQVLTQLADIYPIAQMVVDYRQLVKLKSTYVEALPKLINQDTGRIHTTFNQTIAATGRLSSTDPNLQNIPIRTELGRKVRMAFVPQNSSDFIVSADYSQIELRIMAYFSKDEHLINAFKEGLDVHSATASILFEKSLDEIDKKMRRVAKTVNFGIMYGLGSFGLAQRLGISRTEGKDIIDNYFDKYPGIKRYMEETKKKTQELGYSETLLGRRRYFPEILNKNHNLRNAAERAAINMPIQGTAADMLKIAMIKVNNSMIENQMNSLMTIQVHDELVFEVPENELDKMKEIIKQDMESAMPLDDVPITVDIGVGKNWYEAH